MTIILATIKTIIFNIKKFIFDIKTIISDIKRSYQNRNENETNQNTGIFLAPGIKQFYYLIILNIISHYLILLK